MDDVKEAFSRVKEDILNIAKEFYDLKSEMIELKHQLENTNKMIERLELEQLELEKSISLPIIQPTTESLIQYQTEGIAPVQEFSESSGDRMVLNKLRQMADENQTASMHIPTDNLPLQAPKNQNFDFSIGNGGVPTDRQTDRQTDQQTHFSAQLPKNLIHEEIDSTLHLLKKNSKLESNSDFEKADAILASLDSLKKEIRLKFKRLTDQEMLVFSTIYLLEEENSPPDYRKVAEKLNLTESSIRDYTLKIAKKGIPILKEKQNNKKILLKISPELKKLTSLPSIIQLREL
ncbi:hypothetical protein COV15_01285 [Candidatus Woesearchaeota archaeon CG10_big_fil_rev_8_21_14_0_10_34_12]|nr:MAG: hypothetical protein COV15_01285 [Candidatus Woesearchaeota archaeon CG10_big_fil_rev_8_21_14_0_10_34_12]